MLVLTREASKWEDKARAYRVFVDGVKIDEIRDGETKQFDLPEGEHSLVLKIDWCSSRVQEVTVEKGKTVYARCAPAKKPFLFRELYITFLARRYIDLTITEAE